MKAEEGVTGGTRRPGLYQDDTRSACFPRELLSPQAAPGQECPGQMGRSRRRHGRGWRSTQPQAKARGTGRDVGARSLRHGGWTGVRKGLEGWVRELRHSAKLNLQLGPLTLRL